MRLGKDDARAPQMEAAPPFFSVVIPTFSTVDRAVESCLRQIFCDFEVIVVYDGSEDDAGVVGAVRDGRVRYLRRANAGAAAARNPGAAAAGGCSGENGAAA